MPEFVVIKHLPLTNPEHLFGRDEALVWLEKCWTERAFVASISAWGGVGKTSLVMKSLCAMRDAGWPGAERVFVWSFYGQGMRTAGSSDGFFAAALEAFGDSDPLVGSPWDKGERLGKLVREKRTLLVLDGIEPMQWGPGEQEGRFKDPALQTLVQDLAVNNKGLLLMTSRFPVRDAAGLAGEKVRSRELKHLSPEAGADLLRARKVQGTDEELRQASTEYDGHALALTLLGSYLEDIAEGDIRRRNEIGSLLHDEREGGHARRVMASYEPLLGQTERAILKMLGLFDRPATEDEVAALRAEPAVPGLTDSLANVDGHAWNKAIAKLRRIGLIGAKISNDIDAHPLVRQHFSEQLKNENIDAFREGHRRLYEFLQKKAPPLPETIAEMEPLYAAVVHGCLAGKKEEALFEVFAKRMRRVNEHFSLRKLGAFGHELAMLSAFFDRPWERFAPGLSESWQVVVLNEAGVALRALGRSHEAGSLLRLALDRCVAREHWRWAADAACNLSDLLQSRGALREALDVAHQSVGLANKSGDAFLRIIVMATLGAMQHALGQRNEAVATMDAADRLQQEEQPQYPLLSSLQGFRYYDLLTEVGHDAVVRVRAGTTLTWTIGCERGPLDIALNHLSIGRAHLAGLLRGTGGELNEATSHMQQAVDGLRKFGALGFIPLGLLARAELHIYTPDFANARRDLDEAMTIATRCGFRLHECDAHLGYARLAIAEVNWATAGEHLEKARKIVEATGYHRRDGELAALDTEIATMATSAKHPPNSNASTEIAEGETSPVVTVNHEPFDIAIICALHEPELEHAKWVASAEWTKCSRPNDTTTYEETTYTTKEGNRLRVVAAAASQMGMPASAVLATKMIFHFQPKLLAMVGIAAGVEGDGRGFGDILAPDCTLDYGAGKIVQIDDKLDFQPDPKPLNIDAKLQKRLEDWQRSKQHELLSIKKSFQSKKPDSDLKMHVGTLASGAAVVAAADRVEEVRKHWRKLIGIEMETYGVHLACREAVGSPPMFLCMKSICDFANAKKNDDWRHYAAHTSARLCHMFLMEEWESLFPR